MTSLKEKQIEKMLDKLFGDADPTLRIVSKLALTNTELTPEIISTVEYLKKQNEEEAKALNEELAMTLDANGNLVPIEPILKEKRTFTEVIENVVCPITYTIEDGVVNNLNGVIDCGGNLVQSETTVGQSPYRLPVGKT
jgi:hypothetical protein